MTYTYTPPTLTGGMDDSLVEVANAVNILVPMFLLFVFGVVLLGGTFSQKRRTGTADLPVWATLASITTLMVSLLMTLKKGLITITQLGIVVALTILSGVWLFMSRSKGEV